MNETVSGPIAAYAVENVKRLRAERRWSLADLSTRLKKVGRPILANGLNRLENGNRRVAVDDLIGLAAAFEVSPITLLLPATMEGEVKVTEKITVPAATAWGWLQGHEPLEIVGTDEGDDVFESIAFSRRALPSGLRVRGVSEIARQQRRRLLEIYRDHPELTEKLMREADMEEARRLAESDEHDSNKRSS